MPTADGPNSSAHGVAWNLDDLYHGPKDKTLDTDLSAGLKRSQAFEATYRGTIAAEGGIEPSGFFDALVELEAILDLIGRALSYAHLLHSANSENPAHGALLQSVLERTTEIRKHLIFFELEWLQLPDEDAARIAGASEVATYLHYLESERRYRPHRLSEPEEKILDEKANTGARAFSRLFDEVVSAARFRIDVDGEVRDMSQEEVLALLYHPDRERRRAAAAGFSSGLQSQSRLLTYIFNVMVQDHKVDDGLRSYPGPMASRNLSNEIDDGVVQALLTACESGHDIVQRYYGFKAGYLGFEKLYDYDRYAPVLPDQPAYDWDTCRETVELAYGDFHPPIGDIVREFFENSWIDAELRSGKRGGAFCSGTVPSLHPYILVNYTDRIRDVMTVAHELGHGVHQYVSRKVGYLQHGAPLILAETASVFGEMLVFHRLMEIEKDSRIRLGLLCSKLEDAFATVFRQIVLTRFEEGLHAARREEGELTADRMGEVWMEANRPMHGDTVTLTDDYSHWWMYIPHFIHSPFYCYAYAFGEILVLSLYRRYREQGSEFVSSYLDLLEAGGSEAPGVLLSRLGIDISDPEFYRGGIQILREMVEETERLRS